MKLKNLLILLLILLFTSRLKVLSQNDSANFKEYNLNSNDSSKNFRVVDFTKHFYRDEANVQIIKRGKKFYKLNFSNSGKIISKAKVDIDFIQEISFMTESPSNDSTPSQIINYDIVFKLNGKYEEWYENGKIKLIGNYWWDKKNKIWIEYDNKGKLIKKEHWKYGVKL